MNKKINVFDTGSRYPYAVQTSAIYGFAEILTFAYLQWILTFEAPAKQNLKQNLLFI